MHYGHRHETRQHTDRPPLRLEEVCAVTEAMRRPIGGQRPPLDL